MRQRIAIGSHLISPRDHYSHHGIYIGRGRVIHYSGKSQGLNTGPVEIASLDAFAQGRGYRVKLHPSPRHTRRETVERARSRVGENLYSLTRNNCEHFCEWCITGRSLSRQVHRAAQAVTTTGSVALSASRVPQIASTLMTMSGVATPPAALFALALLLAYQSFRHLSAQDEA